MTWRAVLALAAMGVLGTVSPARADEGFDASAYEKKAFEFTGFLEARPERQWLRRDSAGYLLLYPGEARATADRAATAAEISGVLRHKSLSFNFTGHASWLDEPRGSDADARMYEAYGGWQIDPRSNVAAGKRALRWGKGYAWSPVAFLERPKDPADPELAREGFVMATGSWVRSFDGTLQTLAVTGVVVPTHSGMNPDFGGGAASAGHSNAAVKLYALVHDTDIDLIWAARGSRGPRIGVDFSRNLGNNLEIHGEWARVRDEPRAGSLRSALFGLRYLSTRDTTVIFELYRNGGGLGSDEPRAFSRPNAARSYAYLRASQKEPFDILYFTPAVTLIANPADRSWSLTPELLYTGFKNVELRARVQVNGGGRATEFGEKAVRSRLEFRARFFF